MTSPRLPIVVRWQESFATLKEAGRTVTVQGGSWVIRNATVVDTENLIVVLDVAQQYVRDDKGAMGIQPAMRALVSYDSIAGISFERTEDQETQGE